MKLPVRLYSILLPALVTFTAPACLPAQEPVIPTLRGAVTAIQSPASFDVNGYHVLTSPQTQWFSDVGKKTPADVQKMLVIGASVQIIGDKDGKTRTVTARVVKVRDDAERSHSGVGLVMRVLSTEPQTLIEADGYTLRIDSDTDVQFHGEVKSLADLKPGILIRYEGHRNDSGQVDLDRADLVRQKLSKSKHKPETQVTEIPPRSIIDLDGSFQVNPKPDPTRDTPGGLCGWYPVPDVPSVQKHLRDVGMKLIPQYQRDLPDDDPAKIHFRFYLIDEANIRGALSCHEGLVMVPVSVVNRVQNESQLAAVLADGVAASLQRGQARYAIDWKVAAGEVGLTLLAAAADSWGLNLASSVGEEAMKRSILRKLEDQRGRIALSLLADAGYDPWQAPEAWRLLVPDKLPNNPAKLKYPHISDYQLGILGFAYKRAAPGVATVTTAAQ